MHSFPFERNTAEKSVRTRWGAGEGGGERWDSGAENRERVDESKILGGKIYFETATCHGQEKRSPPPPPPSNSSIQNLPRNRLFIHQCEICSHGWWGATATTATRHRWRGFHGATNKFPYDDSTLTNGTMESDYHGAERHRSIFDRVPRRLQDVWPLSVCCEDVLLLNSSGARFLFCFSGNFNFEESFVLLLRVNYVWHVCWYNVSL